MGAVTPLQRVGAEEEEEERGTEEEKEERMGGWIAFRVFEWDD